MCIDETITTMYSEIAAAAVTKSAKIAIRKIIQLYNAAESDMYYVDQSGVKAFVLMQGRIRVIINYSEYLRPANYTITIVGMDDMKHYLEKEFSKFEK